MIHFIKGRVVDTFEGGIVLENGKIGYEIHVPALSAVYLASADEEVTVYTAMMVREDDVSLYGFDDRDSLKVFQLLRTVSGVGAKAAISILSALSVSQVRQAVMFGDPDTLSKAQGIGKKTAQRIVLELKDKIEKIHFSGINASSEALATKSSMSPGEISGENSSKEFNDAVAALMALGFSKAEASEAIVLSGLEGASAEEYIKAGLKSLSRL